MTSLSITIFILFATLIFLLIPFVLDKFTSNPFTLLILKRCSWIIAIYLMMLNSSVVAAFASLAGFDTAEIFRYMWLFGIFGYLLMMFTFIKTLFDIVETWKKLVNEKRGLE